VSGSAYRANTSDYLMVGLFSNPTCVITIHQRYRRTDSQTDGQTICQRKRPTALCVASRGKTDDDN